MYETKITALMFFHINLPLYFVEPSSPTNIQVTTRTEDSLTIKWTKVGSSDGFLITLTDESSVIIGPYTVENVDTYAVESLKPGNLYNVAVIAYIGSEQIESSPGTLEGQATSMIFIALNFITLIALKILLHFSKAVFPSLTDYYSILKSENKAW